ncbi:hypothetical protein JCM11491_006862 [Sporobolomyces phaffii]
MPPRKRLPSADSHRSPPPRESEPEFTQPPPATYYSYRVGRGEQLVLTFEPYKSYLLPLWRFKTAAIAQQSAAELAREFTRFGTRGDFVGMDMARKFLQMGMTRAARYANRAGGKKYDPDSGRELARTTDHPGAADKRAASAVFRRAWERAKQDATYRQLRDRWDADKAEWQEHHPDDVIELEMSKKDTKDKDKKKKKEVKPDDDDEEGRVSGRKRRRKT